MDYELGKTYIEKFRLNEEDWVGDGCACRKTEKTDYGFKYLKMTNWITIAKSKIFVYKDGFAKSVTNVDTNYRPKVRETCYYDQQGFEIIGKTTRGELSVWKKLRKEVFR
jgi:hypothetical protein